MTDTSVDSQLLFEQCWMGYVDGGLQWSQLIGCFFIFYCYLFAEKKPIWNVLLAHGITGFAGCLVETLFQALRCAGNTDPNVAYLIAFNEINWIIFEASTVLFSYIKASTVIINERVRTAANVFMAVAFVIFAGLRINIGRLRFAHNRLGDAEIGEAHSYAFIIWGITDLLIFFIMMYATASQMGGKTGVKSVVGTFVKSSVPRIGIICLNTFAIVVLGQITNPAPRASNYNTLLWAIKGSYPCILLIDVLVTREMLMPSSRATASSSGGNGQMNSQMNSQMGTKNSGHHK